MMYFVRDAARVARGAALVGQHLAKLEVAASQVKWSKPLTPILSNRPAENESDPPFSDFPIRVEKPDTPDTENSQQEGTAVPLDSSAKSTPGHPESFQAPKPSDGAKADTASVVRNPDDFAPTGAGTATTPYEQPSRELLEAEKIAKGAKPPRERGVPSHPVTRAFHFGGLGLGLASGAAAAAMRRAMGGGGEGSGMLTEANIERLAGTLCRLRGAALKLGQMLSFNNAEVLPKEMQQLMDKVRHGADWMPAWQLKKTMEQELGPDWRQHVASFDETPFAAASIGQVHPAVLTDGRRVAVKVQYPGVATSIQSDLWSMKTLISYTGVAPPGLYLDKVIEVAREELLEECDYVREASNTKKFKTLLSAYPEYAVPAVVPQLSSERVLTTEWMPGVAVDEAAAKSTMSARERDRVGSRLLWLTLTELFTFRFMQTDPNWSNFLYDQRTGQLALIDFGACRTYDAPFADEYLRLVRACAEGISQRDAILHHSRNLSFLTGEEDDLMLDAHVNAAVLVGSPFAATKQPFDFGAQDIGKRVAADVSTMIQRRKTPPRKEIYSLHRRLNGCFQLASRVGARIQARDILLDFYEKHHWSGLSIEEFEQSKQQSESTPGVSN
mmetsp:Transcript_23992/g.46759  ORF Transcript_23992/g.46759 Transcript_23992/m.46759 type:complete len:614 (+) Transcript_23992:190-2031(+)